MKDEERAEEYFCEHCENSLEHDNGQCSNCSKWDCFIAGLKEGRKEKWHNLRKDPNDLPKLEDKRFWWSITVANQDGEACMYNYKRSCWQNSLAGEIDEVIAWCELPKFEE